MADDWRTPDVEALFEAILRLETLDETERFFRDLCTLNELRDMAQRWAVVRMLDSGLHYAEISRRDRRQHGDDHPDRVLAQPRRGRLSRDARQARRGVAVRARPPTPSRASDEPPPAPRDPEQGSARRADPAAPPRRRPRLRGARPQPRRPRPELRPRHPVRPDERRHRVRRRRRRRPRDHRRRPPERDRRRAARVRPLGYGRCRLAAAVPNDTRYQTVEDLAGLRVATAHPNTARRFFEERDIPVEIIPISGAVEVAPRLGLAEGIVDLVSTGSTLVMNGLRQIGDVLDSEAILVANPAAVQERAGGPRRRRHDAERGHRRARSQVPDDERPGAAPRRSSNGCSPRSSRRPSSRSPTPG